MNIKHWKQLVYSDNYKNVSKQLDALLPISLINFDEIIDDIHQELPQYSRLQIEIVVRTFFKQLRRALICAKIVNIYQLIGKLYLAIFQSNKKNGLLIKVILTTNHNIRNGRI